MVLVSKRTCKHVLTILGPIGKRELKTEMCPISRAFDLYYVDLLQRGMEPVKELGRYVGIGCEGLDSRVVFVALLSGDPA